MRVWRLTPAAFVLFLAGSAFAQPPSPQASASLAGAERGGGAWIEYTNRADRFSVNFPGDPKVQAITYTSGLDGVFPARVYTAERGRDRYSVTVVDYTDAERIHTERAKRCPPDAQSLCLGTDADGAQGPGGWKYDVLGAVDFATWDLLKRDAKVTYFAWANIDRISGRQIHFTNAGQRMLADVIPLGGGVPIKVGDDTIGAVGLSGAAGGQVKEEACGNAGIAKVAHQLK